MDVVAIAFIGGAIIGIPIGIVVALLARLIKNRRKAKKQKTAILHRSNIVQYDYMGCPLRLCVVQNSAEEHAGLQLDWLDSDDEEGDVEIRWK